MVEVVCTPDFDAAKSSLLHEATLFFSPSCSKRDREALDRLAAKNLELKPGWEQIDRVIAKNPELKPEYGPVVLPAVTNALQPETTLLHLTSDRKKTLCLNKAHNPSKSSSLNKRKANEK